MPEPMTAMRDRSSTGLFGFKDGVEGIAQLHDNTERRNYQKADAEDSGDTAAWDGLGGIHPSTSYGP